VTAEYLEFMYEFSLVPLTQMYYLTGLNSRQWYHNLC